VLVGAGGLAIALVLAGIGLSIYYMLHPIEPTPAISSSEAGGVSAKLRDPRDVLAERPMPTANAEAAHPGPLTTKRFRALVLPGARRLGAAGVSTGFPHTPAGALAQLIAIDQAALQSASVPAAQQVITAWATPGGPTAESWSGVKAIAAMLSAAGLPDSGSPSFTVSATPELGLVKGTVGDGYAVVCVDFVVTATLTATARTAVADCQRMVWTDHDTTSHDATDSAGGQKRRHQGGRWLVGPGPEPAQPPSVWPGTQAAHTAGYRELRYA
jgi:hypothetical protein